MSLRPVLSLFMLCAAAVAQADEVSLRRASASFEEHCARCHTPQEMGARLRAGWVGRSAAELREQIRATMPAEEPGALSEQTYLEVTEHVLALSAVRLPEAALSESDLPALTIRPGAPGDGDAVAPARDWLTMNGSLGATRYSPADLITRENAEQLRVVWELPTGMFGPSAEGVSTTTAVIAAGALFATAGRTRNVIALDPGTGQLRWMWRPQEGERAETAARPGSGRGVAYWNDGEGRTRIFTVTPGYSLVSLDARTGIPDPDFGAGGWVDLREGLRRAEGREDLDIGLSMPPLVVGDVVVVGAAHRVSFRPPSPANVKGDVRGFDARTGERLWTFETIPEPGEPGSETWQNGSETFTGNAGVWAPLSADPELGLVYLPVESATGDRFGGDRPGANLYANSVVALDYRTGELRWHYQIIHHDIWDWDNPAAPVLADLPDGRKLLVQLTKQNFAYVFDRETGEPIWPIEERPVPQSDVPGEWTSPTQPFPTRPAPYGAQGMAEDDLIDFTPELRAAALEAVEPYRMGPLFTPPSLHDAPDGTRGTLSVPSATGGTNWEGGAYDPETGWLFVPSFNRASLLALAEDPDSSVAYVAAQARTPRVQGLPLLRPPWGTITAIDLSDGEHRWQVPNGDTPEDVASHAALEGIDLPRTGKPTRSGLLVTPTLLFAGEGRRGSPVFRALDKESGEIVAEIALPAAQTGQPVTYVHGGRQYIAMSVGGAGEPARLVALGLPEE